MLAILMGIGMAAVYKHIPTYFPNDVGTVGGLVGVIGGLGGFVDPILFGYLLQRTGIWTAPRRRRPFEPSRMGGRFA